MGPVKLSYRCTLCDYTGSSARQLSRHKAVTHVKNPLTCILCPFVTAYQTNLLRHRREVHGILGSKGNKSCKFCGFEAADNDTLILHQQQAHQDILKCARERFAREKKSARGNCFFGNSETASQATDDAQSSVNNSHEDVYDENNRDENGRNEDEDEDDDDDDDDDDKDFWKEGFMDNPPNLLINLSEPREQSYGMNSWMRNVGQACSPMSFENSMSDYNSSRASTPLPVSKSHIASPTDPTETSLAPTRIRRQYTCHDCGIRTVNPREFLYHRRDVHNQKVKIVECPYCVYACQYFQKLQRHILLVHKLETSMTPPAEVLAASQNRSASAESKTQSLLQKIKTEGSAKAAAAGAVVPPLKLKVKPKQNAAKPSIPSIQQPPTTSPTRSTSPLSQSYSYSMVMSEEGKTIADESIPETVESGDGHGVKRKYFHCDTCGYKTNVQYLFKKHTKYHTAPKIKCDMCDFESPYSWNVERHARSHRSNGAYKCLKCNFSSDKPQAITIHVNQHHRDSTTGKVDSVNISSSEGCYFPREANAEREPAEEYESEGNQRSVVDQKGEMETKHTNYSDGDQLGASTKPRADTCAKGSAQASTGKSVTYVRKADGKIVAKPAVGKKCKYCSFQADTFAKVQKHEASFHPEKRYQCPLCEIRFENLVWLQRHLTHMHQEDDQASNIVNILDLLNPKKKKLSNRSQLEQSLNDSDPLKKLESLDPRKKISLDKASTKCRICGYQTRWISELQKHMRVHTKEKPFVCPYCSFRSKWKGDLNRHVQKYHSRLPMPDLNAMEQAALRAFSVEPAAGEESEPQEDPSMGDYNYPDDKEFHYRNAALDGDDGNYGELPQGNSVDAAVDSNEEDICGIAGKIRVYKCCYCEFTCTTASRFHVHFVQHLNTKPFMCSMCGHRSNWEWDVTKHIKMKSQRDPEHYSAKPVLIHDSGKRDYRKYNKYLIWVDEDHANHESHFSKVDIRVKRQKTENDESYGERGATSYMTDHHGENEVDENENAESIVITPDISYAFSSKSKDQPNGKEQSYQPVALQPNVPYTSEKPAVESPGKLFYCAYCDYTHRDSKALVSHLSVHAKRKPYKCGYCGFSSNWKEVVSRHASSRHNGSVKDVEQLFKYTVNKYICRIVDDSGGVEIGPEVANPQSDAAQTSADGITLPESKSSPESQQTKQASRISGFKGAFKCSICPFRAEKAFHMDFHLKRHQQVKGADFKCPHCPYWVNAKKSLVKHIYLHDYQSEVALQEENVHKVNNLPMEDDRENDEQEEDEEGLASMPEQAREAEMNSEPQVNQSASVFKYKCDDCPFVGGTKTQLLYHKQFHRPNRNAAFKCNLCSYAVSHQHLLNQHMRVHGKDAEPQYDSEDVSESDREEPDVPFVLMDNDGGAKKKVYQCRYCPTTSKRRMYIVVHEQMHSQNSSESFKCSQCAFCTKNSTAFLAHVETHNREKENEGEENQSQHQQHPAHANAEESYKFIKQCEQFQHEQQTTTGTTMSVVESNSIKYGNRRMFSYVCPNCPAAFKSPGDLKIHTAFHGEVTYPHLCPYCTYRAKNKPQLCKHLYVHTADYITKRANSYPQGMKLTIGNAVNKMKNDLQSPQKDEPSSEVPQPQNLPAPPPLYKPQLPSEMTRNVDINRSPSKLKSFVTSTVSSHSQPKPSVGHPTDMAADLRKPPNLVVRSLRPSLVHNTSSPLAQMVVLENQETKAYTESLKPKVQLVFNHRCVECPASFVNLATLEFHEAMHKFSGQHKCNVCSYSSDNFDSLVSHLQLHSVVSGTRRARTKLTFRCPHCPGLFTKTNALSTHTDFHNSEWAFKCSHCDYARNTPEKVKKHELVHGSSYDWTLDTEYEGKQSDICPAEDVHNIDLSFKLVPSDSAKETIWFRCDRCPYASSKCDEVEAHNGRHNSNLMDGGTLCDHCDYVCPETESLSEHIKLHFEPLISTEAASFYTYNDFEVWTVDEQAVEAEEKANGKTLLFKDAGINSDADIGLQNEPIAENEVRENNMEINTNNVDCPLALSGDTDQVEEVTPVDPSCYISSCSEANVNGFEKNTNGGISRGDAANDLTHN